jgi:deoxycytidine triphosphate deaminase
MFNIKITTEDVALHNVNEFQEFMTRAEIDKKENIKLLENEGWKIEFGYQTDVFGIEEDTVICFATKEVGEDKRVQFIRKAKVAPGDIYLAELGEYLALSRIITAIKGE